jgi:hypothetical protein
MHIRSWPPARLAVAVLAASFLAAGCGQAETRTIKKADAVNPRIRTLSGQKVTLRIGEKTFAVALYDNPTAADLLSKLPLNVRANNYPGYDEKVLRLAAPLSMSGAPREDNPDIPEVGYYGPGQWIALYYGHIGSWPGKVPLGRIDASVEELRAIRNDAPVSISQATPSTARAAAE